MSISIVPCHRSTAVDTSGPKRYQMRVLLLSNTPFRYCWENNVHIFVFGPGGGGGKQQLRSRFSKHFQLILVYEIYLLVYFCEPHHKISSTSAGKQVKFIKIKCVQSNSHEYSTPTF